jgi:hypothetical protein
LATAPAAPARAQSVAGLLEDCEAAGDAIVEDVLGRAAWDLDGLTARAVPEYTRVVPRDRAETIFRPLNRFLGALLRHNPPQLDVAIRRRGESVTTVCAYRALGTFDNYNATALLQLGLRDEQWRVLSLRLDIGDDPATPPTTAPVGSADLSERV